MHVHGMKPSLASFENVVLLALLICLTCHV